MEIRKTFLPGDLQYCLDGASESQAITVASDIAIRLYGSSEKMDAIWNAPSIKGLSHRKWLGLKEIETEVYGIGLIRQLPEARQGRLILNGLGSIYHFIYGLAECLCWWRYEDMTKGGSLKPFLKVWNLDNKLNPTKKTARRLESVQAIRRYVKQSDMEHLSQLYSLLRSLGLPGEAEDDDALLRDLNGQLESHRVEARKHVKETEFWEEQVVKASGQPNKKSMRKVTKRAALLAAALLGSQTVSAFARGEPVVLFGPDIDVSVKLARSIHSSGHGALMIGLSGADGVELSKLCLYQDAPALDQLASLAMHVQSGHTDKLIDTGNLYAVKDRSHPVIEARMAKSAARAAENGIPVLGVDFFIDQNINMASRKAIDAAAVHKQKTQEYKDRFVGIYAGIVAECIMGSNSPYDRFAMAGFKGHAARRGAGGR